MTSTIEAKYLNGASLGKSVEAQAGTAWAPAATLRAVQHNGQWTELVFDDWDTQLRPTELVRITGTNPTTKEN
jgi:hypothetical protein